MAEFNGRGRKLDALITWLEKGNEKAVTEVKNVVGRKLVESGKGKENLEVKQVGVMVREIMGRNSAAIILGDSRG